MIIDPYLLMKEALKEADKGFAEGEVPVGALIVDAGGEVIARAHNQPLSRNDPTAHAEILALRTACSLCRNYRLEGATLVYYRTLPYVHGRRHPCEDRDGWFLAPLIPSGAPPGPFTTWRQTTA